MLLLFLKWLMIECGLHSQAAAASRAFIEFREVLGFPPRYRSVCPARVLEIMNICAIIMGVETRLV